MMIVFAGMMAVTGEAGARGPWQRRATRYSPHQHYTPPPSVLNSPQAAYWRSAYPKYDGGFHARHLQNIGIPTGDIGIRGNGITVNPW
jgi:hypothetical protein